MCKFGYDSFSSDFNNQSIKEKRREQQETSENFSEYARVNAVTENLFSSSFKFYEHPINLVEDGTTVSLLIRKGANLQ